eukprot:gene18818-24588_t
MSEKKKRSTSPDKKKSSKEKTSSKVSQDRSKSSKSKARSSSRESRDRSSSRERQPLNKSESKVSFEEPISSSNSKIDQNIDNIDIKTNQQSFNQPFNQQLNQQSNQQQSFPLEIISGRLLTHYDETAGIAIPQNAVEQHRAMGNVVYPLVESYKSRYERLRTILTSKLLPKREHLLQLRRQLLNTSTEIAAVRKGIERETMTDAEQIIERLRAVESMRQSAITHQILQLEEELESIERLAKRVELARDDNINNYAGSSGIVFTSSSPGISPIEPIKLPKATSMVELIQQFADIATQIEKLSTKQINVQIDFPTDDFPKETSERLEIISRSDRYMHAVNVKDHMLWVALQEKQKTEELLNDERQLSSEYAIEVSEWANIATVYSQPIKIALAITITSLLVVVKQFRDSEQNGFWAVVVICLIRQDNASSSFITAYQRILGTVIGSVYAFSMYEAMNCSSYVSTNKPTTGFSCGATNTIPVLLLWLGVCCYFREGPRYGYAALVAGFTPIVLLDGYVPGTSSGAWARVQKTIIGSAKRKSMRQLELDVQDIAVDVDMNSDIDHQLDINTYEKCLEHLLVVDKKWKQFDLSQKKLSGMLKLVIYDPEIWHKPFPVQAYNNLNNNFKRLIESVNTLSQATRYLQAAMLKNDSSINSKSSKSQLNSYEHMSHRIFTVVIRTTTALNMSREALQRLYHNDLYGDMTALITLSRYFDLLLNEIDEHFRIYLQTHPFDPKGIDISIVLTWQNVFEAECDLIKNISALGVTLHSVRNVEALSAI